jgi:hypothetical protein
MAGDEPGGGIRDVLGFRRVDIGDGALIAKPPAALRLQTLEADCSLASA